MKRQFRRFLIIQLNIRTLPTSSLNRREYEYAEKVYIKARATQNPAIYNYELARIYYYMRNYDRMLNEYMEWMKQKGKQSGKS